MSTSLLHRLLAILALMWAIAACSPAGETSPAQPAPRSNGPFGTDASDTVSPEASTTTPVATDIGDAIASGPAPAPALRVVATFSVLGDFVHQVGGDLIDLTTLVGPGGDTQSYAPNPLDRVKLAHSSVIFENGLGLERWLDKLYAASGSTATRVVVTAQVRPRQMASDHLTESNQPGVPAVRRVETDPYAWQDVHNAMLIVAAIRNGLSDADPADRTIYQANAERYLDELRALDAEIVAQVDSLPADRRRLVTSHDTFGYFGARYGLQILDSAGVSVGLPLLSDALGEPGGPGDTYVKMMRYNVATIVTALAGSDAP